ncbi:MAG: hypothetical protein EBR82_37750 [Caulobacteraceae bacterium]|nr:hypothetical protein [Caulobacteraceae bacterium]
MIPAELPLEIAQAGTFNMDVQLLQNARSVELTAGSDLFALRCHGFSAGDLVGFQSSAGTFPCGLAGVAGFYVIASGLTTNEFRVSATSGGASVGISPLAQDLTGIEYKVGRTVNITSATFDADIKSTISGALVASFTVSTVNALAGIVRMTLPFATTTAMPASDQYAYDLNYRISGESYYPFAGPLTIVGTQSRP